MLPLLPFVTFVSRALGHASAARRGAEVARGKIVVRAGGSP
jgi:hypothetical protein